jgi:multiple sugar transport system substrate-binding protein
MLGFTINGTQYMLPFNKSNEVLYYNADLLQKLNVKPPTTLQEFVNTLKQVTKPGERWGLSFTPSVDEWSILYKALGGKQFTSPDGQSTAFDKGSDKTYAQQALDLLTPLVKSGAVHVTSGYSWQNDFVAQKSVFALATIASYPFLAAGIKNSFKFDEAPIPGGPAGNYTILYGTNLALFKGVSDDTRAAAWDFMKFLTSKDANIAFVKGTGYMPIRKSVFHSSELQDYYNKVPARKVGPQLIDSSFVPSILPGWESCRDDITNEFTSSLKGLNTSDVALTKMAQQCSDSLAS